MNLIAYVRVSTLSQNYEGQIEVITAFAKARGHNIIEIYHEKESGAKERLELNKAIKALDHADGLIATKIDRVSRSFTQFENLTSQLEANKKALFCVQQNIDTSDQSPTGRAFVRMLAIFSELEREFILERTTEGRERAKREGRRLGGRAPFELDKDTVLALRRQGFSWKSISRKVKTKDGKRVSSELIGRRLKQWSEGVDI